MAAGSHFGCPKITSYHNFYFANLFTKWLPVAILDVQNSLSMAFLAISDQYEIIFFIEIFYKMAAGAHYGCPKFTFDRISNHFRSIRNFFLRRPYWMSEIHFRSHFWPFSDRYATLIFYGIFVDKMAAVGHFGCPKFTFNRISGQFRSILNFYFFKFCLQNGRRRPFWMSEIHFRSHFWPFQIDMQLCIFFIFHIMAYRRTFWMSEIHF